MTTNLVSVLNLKLANMLKQKYIILTTSKVKIQITTLLLIWTQNKNFKQNKL